MIILSQDKTRITENMEIGIYPEYKSNKFEIDYYIIKNNCTELGIYKKEERAKEVLQEILKFRKSKLVMTTESITSEIKDYFEMPEEKEL